MDFLREQPGNTAQVLTKYINRFKPPHPIPGPGQIILSLLLALLLEYIPENGENMISSQ